MSDLHIANQTKLIKEEINFANKKSENLFRLSYQEKLNFIRFKYFTYFYKISKVYSILVDSLILELQGIPKLKFLKPQLFDVF